jgi:hypothetical protein
VARTDEAALTVHPRNCAAKMCALTRQGQKTTVLEPRKIELPFLKCCHCVWLESVDRSGYQDVGTVRDCRWPWTEEIRYDPYDLDHGYSKQPQRELAQEATA